jgi:hypothetical protein
MARHQKCGRTWFNWQAARFETTRLRERVAALEAALKRRVRKRGG